jgi:hypothetical protein
MGSISQSLDLFLGYSSERERSLPRARLPETHHRQSQQKPAATALVSLSVDR